VVAHSVRRRGAQKSPRSLRRSLPRSEASALHARHVREPAAHFRYRGPTFRKRVAHFRKRVATFRKRVATFRNEGRLDAKGAKCVVFHAFSRNLPSFRKTRRPRGTGGCREVRVARKVGFDRSRDDRCPRRASALASQRRPEMAFAYSSSAPDGHRRWRRSEGQKWPSPIAPARQTGIGAGVAEKARKRLFS
jgi:hypothetical protein